MHGSGATTGRRSLAVLAVAAALAMAGTTAAVAAAPTSTATTSGSDRAAEVQAVLDRVLGPGNAVVVVSDTIRTSTAATTSVQWGSGVAGSAASDVLTVGGRTTSKWVAQQNLVDGTRTSTVTPPGSLVRRSVSVAVDRAHVGSTTVAALRRLVSSASGLTPSRGDRLSLVVTRFARPAAVAPAPASSPLALLLPAGVPLIWAFGGLLALVVLVRTAGVRSRRARVPVHR